MKNKLMYSEITGVNYSETLKRESFFSVKEKVFGGIGVTLDKVPTAEEAIRQAGCDYQVGIKPALIEFNGQTMEIPNQFATYRMDNGTPLGAVGSRYTVIQNAKAFSFFDHIVGKGEAQYETAGALFNGEIVFVCVKLPDYMRVMGDDVIEKYLVVVNYHDGKRPLIAMLTPVRVWCNNTIIGALNTATMKINVRHTAKFERTFEEAPRLLGITNQLTTDLQEVYQLMARKKLVDKDLKEMILKTLASPEALNTLAQTGEVSTALNNKIEKVLEYAFTAESQLAESTKGTVWGAYNAVTGYLQNVKNWKSDETKFDSTFHGKAEEVTQKIFDLCLEKIR